MIAALIATTIVVVALLWEALTPLFARAAEPTAAGSATSTSTRAGSAAPSSAPGPC